MGRGFAAGREAPWRRVPRPPAPRNKRGARQAARYRPAPGSPPAAGNHSIHSQLARGLGLQRAHHAGYAPADRYDTDHDPSPRLRRRHVPAAETPIYQARFTNDFRY